jgi:hypothetical protein
MRLHPRATHNHRGEPVFDLSDAKHLLQEDVKNGMHTRLSPSDMQLTRPEYVSLKLIFSSFASTKKCGARSLFVSSNRSALPSSRETATKPARHPAAAEPATTKWFPQSPTTTQDRCYVPYKFIKE